MKLKKAIQLQSGTVIPAGTELHFGNEGFGYFNGEQVFENKIPEDALEVGTYDDAVAYGKQRQATIDAVLADKRIQNHYDVVQVKATVMITTLNGGDFPYKLTITKGDPKLVNLYQGYQERTNLPMKMNLIKGSITAKDAIDRIIKRHNKADEHMHWGQIATESMSGPGNGAEIWFNRAYNKMLKLTFAFFDSKDLGQVNVAYDLHDGIYLRCQSIATANKVFDKLLMELKLKEGDANDEASMDAGMTMYKGTDTTDRIRVAY